MNLTDDIILKLQLGYPIDFNDFLKVYPTTVGEIVEIGYTKFQVYLSILTAEKPLNIGDKDQELKNILENLSDFQYILIMASLDAQSGNIFNEAFEFFTHENNISLSLDPARIIVGKEEENHFISEEDFYDFQRLLKRAFFLEQEGEEIIISANDPPNVRALKMQMKANREKLRKAKAKQNRQEKMDLQFSDLLASLPFQNCGLNMVNIKQLTYYALHDQLKRSGWHEQFDINNRAAMAGAKLKKNQLQHWIRSIHNSEKS